MNKNISTRRILAGILLITVVVVLVILTGKDAGAHEGGGEDGAYVGNEPTNTVVIEPQSPNINTNVTPEVVDTLPLTGGDVVALALVGGVAVVAGLGLLSTRWKRDGNGLLGRR